MERKGAVADPGTDQRGLPMWTDEDMAETLPLKARKWGASGWRGTRASHQKMNTYSMPAAWQHSRRQSAKKCARRS